MDATANQIHIHPVAISYQTKDQSKCYETQFTFIILEVNKSDLSL